MLFFVVSFLQQISLKHIIRLIGTLGLIFNSFCLYALFQKKLTNKIYAFFWCRTFFNLIICLFAIGWVDTKLLAANKIFDSSDSYSKKFYIWYVFAIPMRIALFSSIISDVVLVTYRYQFIADRYILILTIKQNLAVCFSIPILLCLPYFFVYKIAQTPAIEDQYVLELTEFGRSKFVIIYVTLVYILETFIPQILLIVFNVFSILKFHETMINKRRIAGNRNIIMRSRRAQMKFMRIQIILSSICIVTRVIDLVSGILIRLAGLDQIDESSGKYEAIKKFSDFSSFLLYVVHAFDGLLFFKMDRNLRECARAVFRRTSVICF